MVDCGQHFIYFLTQAVKLAELDRGVELQKEHATCSGYLDHQIKRQNINAGYDRLHILKHFYNHLLNVVSMFAMLFPSFTSMFLSPWTPHPILFFFSI